MPNAVVMTGYGPPEVLKWAEVPLAEPGQGQIRIKVKAAGISPTDLALRAGYLKAFPLPPDAVLGFEAAGTVDVVGLGVTGTSIGDGVTALLFSLGGYAEYAVASIWAGKPDAVSWIDAAALPSSAEAAVGRAVLGRRDTGPAGRADLAPGPRRGGPPLGRGRVPIRGPRRELAGLGRFHGLCPGPGPRPGARTLARSRCSSFSPCPVTNTSPGVSSRRLLPVRKWLTDANGAAGPQPEVGGLAVS
jgi:hypothetical protein